MTVALHLLRPEALSFNKNFTPASHWTSHQPKVELHRRGSMPMRSEGEAQELRNGIHLERPLPPHWRALSARERYLKFLTFNATQSTSGVRWHQLRRITSFVEEIGGSGIVNC